MKEKSIFSSALKLSTLLFASKIAGLLKQMMIVAICGTTYQTDVYFVATGVLFALSSILFSAFSTPLLAIHTERLINGGRERSNALINASLKVTVPVSLLITGLIISFAPYVARGLAPSFEGEQLELLIRAVRVMAFIFTFGGFYFVVGIILETEKDFLPGRFVNLIQNVLVALATIFLFPDYGIMSMIYAFVAAVAIQMILIFWKTRKLFWFSMNTRSEKEAIKKILRLMIPLLIGSAIYEVNDVVDKQIASGLGGGSISLLTCGASINEIVTTLVISAVSSVLFAHYATWIVEGKLQKVSEHLKSSMEYLITLLLPVMTVCLICGDNVVSILYQRGNFDALAVSKTTPVVMGYAAGFCFQAVRANFVKVFYAFQDTKTPMINGAIAIAVNIAMSIILSKYLGVGGIALATSISMMVVSALMLPGIRKRLPDFSLRTLFPECAKALAITALLFPCAHVIKRLVGENTYVQLGSVGLFVLFSYVGLGYLLRLRTIKEILHNGLEKIKGDSRERK
ncbi:MAG: polysaccharide biosynthesis C-terminal domain-containing protein [Acetatifactor sp.]|nr:polysaccharide biosynthesis C-terminal domain-containing protein [Acetatifactor sp.]